MIKPRWYLLILSLILLTGFAFGQESWELGSPKDWLSVGPVKHVGHYYFPNSDLPKRIQRFLMDYPIYTPIYYHNYYPVYSIYYRPTDYPFYNYPYHYPQTQPWEELAPPEYGLSPTKIPAAKPAPSNTDTSKCPDGLTRKCTGDCSSYSTGTWWFP